MFTTDTRIIIPKLLQTVAGIDQFKGAWQALGAYNPCCYPSTTTILARAATGPVNDKRWLIQRYIATALATDAATLVS